MDIELIDKDIRYSVPDMLEGKTLVDADVEEGGAAADEDTGEAPRRDRRSRCGDSLALSLLLTTTWNISCTMKNTFSSSKELIPDICPRCEGGLRLPVMSSISMTKPPPPAPS